jgi:hypothetical protein
MKTGFHQYLIDFGMFAGELADWPDYWSCPRLPIKAGTYAYRRRRDMDAYLMVPWKR